jgi:4-hydroxy-tetrahydrodipicolinate reductase
MKIALVGFGGMGQSAAAFLEQRGHEITSIIDPKHPKATARSLDADAVKGVDIAIEFTTPHTMLPNLTQLLSLNIPTVIGTTGWYDKLDEVKELTMNHNGTALWSSNFSIGVNIYFRLVEAAAKLVNRYDEYDVWATELHHHRKADSPSGTAKTMQQLILKNIERKTAVVEEKLDRAILPHEFHFSSTRGGPINFSHTLGFDSAADTITLTHSARSRDGYALGAVQAAEWLAKQAPGFYSMEDFLGF